MLDVIDSINRLSWTIEHHHAHILNKHVFMRAWAIQFELAYTDFRTIQIALQLSGAENHSLLKEFTSNYEEVYKYEYEFATNGLDGFNLKFNDSDLPKYTEAKNEILSNLDKIKELQNNPKGE